MVGNNEPPFCVSESETYPGSGGGDGRGGSAGSGARVLVVCAGIDMEVNSLAYPSTVRIVLDGRSREPSPAPRFVIAVFLTVCVWLCERECECR